MQATHIIHKHLVTLIFYIQIKTIAHKELRMDADKQTKRKLGKTEYMIIGHPRRTNKVEISQPLHLNDSEIKRVKPLG